MNASHGTVAASDAANPTSGANTGIRGVYMKPWIVSAERSEVASPEA